MHKIYAPQAAVLLQLGDLIRLYAMDDSALVLQFVGLAPNGANFSHR